MLVYITFTVLFVKIILGISNAGIGYSAPS
jgi:hypothetical protein